MASIMPHSRWPDGVRKLTPYSPDSTAWIVRVGQRKSVDAVGNETGVVLGPELDVPVSVLVEVSGDALGDVVAGAVVDVVFEVEVGECAVLDDAGVVAEPHPVSAAAPMSAAVGRITSRREERR